MDDNWGKLIGAVVTLGVAYIGYKQHLSDRKHSEDKKDTDKKLDENHEIGVANHDLNVQVHTLVNSNMGTQLKISAIALQRVADYSKHPDDIAAATLAAKLLAEHETKQSIVDAKAK